MDGARLEKLAIDLEAQAVYIDVFSPMMYHARFGHAGDLAWISRRVTWLGEYLGIAGAPGERRRIWRSSRSRTGGNPCGPTRWRRSSSTECGVRRPA